MKSMGDSLKNKSPYIMRMSLIIGTYWFSQYIYMPFLTPYILGLGITASITGVIVGAYGLTQLCLRFPIGVFADRSQKHLLIIRAGILLSLCSSFGFLIFKSPMLLFISNFVQGLSSSTWLSFVILYSTFFEVEEYQKSVGLSNFFNQAGILASYFVGGLLIDKFGIKLLFVISGILALAAFTMTFGIKSKIIYKCSNNRERFVWKNIISIHTLFYSLMGLIAMFTAFSTAFSFTSTAAKALQATGGELAIISMLFTIFAAVGSYIVSTNYFKYVDTKRVIYICLLIMFICVVIIGNTRLIGLIMIFQALEGITIYLLFSMTMGMATKSIDNRYKSTVMGIFQTIYSAGIFLGPVFMGYMTDIYTLRKAFVMVGLIPIVGLFMNKLYWNWLGHKEE